MAISKNITFEDTVVNLGGYNLKAVETDRGLIFSNFYIRTKEKYLKFVNSIKSQNINELTKNIFRLGYKSFKLTMSKIDFEYIIFRLEPEFFKLEDGIEVGLYFSQNAANWNKPYTFKDFREKLKEISGDCNFIKITETLTDLGEIEVKIKVCRDFDTLEKMEKFLCNLGERVLEELDKDYLEPGAVELLVNDLDLRYALRQYITGFSEYIRKLKKENIDIDVRNSEKGIIIKLIARTSKSDYSYDFKTYLSHSIESDYIPKENELYILTKDEAREIYYWMKQQVNDFNNKIELAKVGLTKSEEEKIALKDEVQNLKEVIKQGHLEKMALFSNKTNINVLVQNSVSNTIENKVEIKENIEEIQEKLMELFTELNANIQKDKLEVLEKVMNEVMELNPDEGITNKKGTLTKLKTTLKGLKNLPEGIKWLSTVITNSKELGEHLWNLREQLIEIIDKLI